MNRNSIISSLLIAFMMQSMCVSAQGTITRKKKENSTTSPTKPKPASKPNKNTSQSINISAQEKERIINNLISNMVYVEGGTFMMGATSEQGSDAYSEEKPAHQVTLSSFSIGKYEVTQEEWQVVMGCNPSSYKGAKRPVEEVSWRDCQEFIRKLNTMTGKRFRLPTEAEWEYAARGGSRTKGYKYVHSNGNGFCAWSGYPDNRSILEGYTTVAFSNSKKKWDLYDALGYQIASDLEPFDCNIDRNTWWAPATSFFNNASSYASSNNIAGQAAPFCATEGYIAAKKDGRCGYLDLDGNEVVPFGILQDVRPVHNGKAWVKFNGKWGVISIKATNQGM